MHVIVAVHQLQPTPSTFGLTFGIYLEVRVISLWSFYRSQIVVTDYTPILSESFHFEMSVMFALNTQRKSHKEREESYHHLMVLIPVQMVPVLLIL